MIIVFYIYDNYKMTYHNINIELAPPMAMATPTETNLYIMIIELHLDSRLSNTFTHK